MINTEELIKKLINEGFTHLCVVPCSFAKNLINGSINQSKYLEYLPCASEAVACSVAAGLRLSGKRPIVVVQSSGLTNMGSCITSLLNPYEIYFPIIVSLRTYNEGDSEIQHKHLAKCLPELVKAYGYNYEILVNDREKVVKQLLSSEKEKKILLLQTGFFSKVELNDQFKINLSEYPSRSEYLKSINNEFYQEKFLFIGTTGNTARELYEFMPKTLNFYMAGNMGGALSVGLGAFLSGRDVVVCGGDAEFVMHLGGLTTAARYKSQKEGKLIYIIFDNESNKSTGGQNTYQNHISYIQLGKSLGIKCYPNIIKSISEFKTNISTWKTEKGILLLHVKCSYDIESIRPPMNKVKESKFIFKNEDIDSKVKIN